MSMDWLLYGPVMSKFGFRILARDGLNWSDITNSRLYNVRDSIVSWTQRFSWWFHRFNTKLGNVIFPKSYKHVLLLYPFAILSCTFC